MIGRRLKELRTKKDLTQKELAKKIGISSSTIAMIESGERNGNKETLDKIAGFFNVTLDYLYGKNDNLEPLIIEKDSIIDSFIDELIDADIVTDPNNIDEETVNMILNAVKAQIALKIKKKK